MERCFVYALETRRRVKEQLKKIGGMEFYDVHFSYIDNESLEEKFVSVPEQRGGSLIPEGPMNPGTMHTVALGTSEHLGLYRIELQVVGGNGKLSISGSGANNKTKEAIRIAFDYFKANISRVPCRVLISALADICLRRYIEKTCQGHGELSLKIQFPVPIFGTFPKTT